MATQVRFPKSYSADASITDPSNGLLADEQYLFTTNGGNIAFYNFDFDLPSGAVINSISVEFKYKISADSGNNLITVKTLKNSVEVGDVFYPSEESLTGKIATKTSNGTWTVSELNDNSLSGFSVFFYLFVQYTGTIIRYIDYAKVIIDFEDVSSTTYSQII